MKTKPMTLVAASTIAVAFLLSVVVLGRPGFAQATLAQVGGCTSPTDSQYCTMNIPNNPCNGVPTTCFDYFRWFTNAIPCANVPGQTVASGSAALINGNTWTGCKAGSTPGYTCTRSEQDCGTFSAYWGMNCNAGTFCGVTAMQACNSQTPYDCPGGPN